jgi:hypothetical protein
MTSAMFLLVLIYVIQRCVITVHTLPQKKAKFDCHMPYRFVLAIIFRCDGNIAAVLSTQTHVLLITVVGSCIHCKSNKAALIF